MTQKDANTLISRYLKCNEKLRGLLTGSAASFYDKFTVRSLIERNNSTIDGLNANYC